MKLLASYTIKVHTWPEATLFNSNNLCIKPYRERRHRSSSSSSSAYGQNSNFNKLKTPDQSRSVEILGGQDMSQPETEGLKFRMPRARREAPRGGVWGSGFYFPKFEVKIGRKFPSFLDSCSPHFRAQPRSFSPSGSVPVLSPLHGPIRPFFFLFLCTPFPPPILVPFSSFSLGAPHPARGSSQPSSVSSPADPGRARPTNGL